MYEHRFGLHRKPFQSALTENDFYESKTHRQIIPAILHALKSDLGVAVLTGPAGCGKTVTAEFLWRLLQADSQTVFLRGGAVRTATELLHSLHRSLRKTSGADDAAASDNVVNNVRRWDILERLQRVCDFWGPIVVMLDDAHLVEPEVFAELRSLLEEEADGRKLLRLLITGPLDLEETLAQPAMTDFAQRIRTHVFLQPLRSDEAVQYLDLQICNSGGALGKIFAPEAIERITAAADGSPRCLSLLADESLVVCDETTSRQQQLSTGDDAGAETSATQSAPRVSGAMVTEALQRLQHLPYAWNASAYVEEDEQQQFSAAESPSEIDSTNSTVSSHGVVEIGSASDSASPDLSSSSVTSGVVEIGFGAQSPTVEFVSERTESLEADSPTADPPQFPSADDDFELNSNETSELPEGTIEIGAAEFFDRVSEYPEFESDVAMDATDDDAVAPVDPAITETGVRNNDMATSSQNLEHHLVLAGGRQVDVTDDAETDSADVAANDAVLSPVAQTEAIDALFDRYSRWQPAGTWPAPAVTSTAKNTPRTNLSNAEPVFDRYTWCELGRPVASEAVQRTFVISNSLTPVWPPDIIGVAPVSSIPIIEQHDEQTDFSAETPQNHPVTAIAVSPAIDINAPLPNVEAEYLDQSVGYIQQLVAEAASEVEDVHMRDAEWIDGQLMKEFETLEQLPGGEGSNDDVCENSSHPIIDAEALIELPCEKADLSQAELHADVNDDTDGSVEQTVLPISGCVPETPSNWADKDDDRSSIDTAVPQTDERLLTLPYSVDEIDQNVPSGSPADTRVPTGSPSVQNNGPISAHDTPHDSTSSGGVVAPGGHATSWPLYRQPTVESTSEEVPKSSREGGYAPRLLNQARERVISIVPPREVLRPAAGAESIAVPVPEALSSAIVPEDTEAQGLPRISMMCDSISTDLQEDLSKDAEQPAEPRFSRLFTRLRQQRAAGE
jgi:type II secretory pathway predicted ATPase ExeA